MITKKDFEQFKKEIKKENKMFERCAFYMTKRQEELHTATVALMFNMSFEKHIDGCLYDINRVSSWEEYDMSEEDIARKYRIIQDYKNDIEYFKEQIAKFGTPTKKAEFKFEQLKNTNAFKKLASLGVSVELTLENDMYYARFHY